MCSQQYKVAIIAGPTAVGKTKVLQQIQSALRNKSNAYSCRRGIEVINCDSIQVYRHLNIASAKPTAIEQLDLPHHLIDFLDPCEEFTAGYFVRQCDALIPQIIERGNIPVISGGTVFYLKNFLYGLPSIPRITGRHSQYLKSLKTVELYEKLRELDRESWQRIHPNDRQHLLRACEVCLDTGLSFSSYKPGNGIRSQYEPLVITLNREREELYNRINLRVRLMFAQGLEKEINDIQNMGYTIADPGIQGIERYREFFLNPGSSKEELLAKIQQNSRNYAKRQLTFLKHLPSREEFHPGNTAAIVQRIADFCSCNGSRYDSK